MEDPTRLLSAIEINELAEQWAKDNGWPFGQALELVMLQEYAKGWTLPLKMAPETAKPKLNGATGGAA